MKNQKTNDKQPNDIHNKKTHANGLAVRLAGEQPSVYGSFGRRRPLPTRCPGPRGLLGLLGPLGLLPGLL